jgi:transporter family-2 protein
MPVMVKHRRWALSGLIPVILVAVVGGIAVTLQAQFMGIMDRGIGTLESVSVTYISGGLIIAVMLLAARGGNLANWPSVPWFALTTGIFGLIIVGSIGFSVQRLGLVGTMTIVVATQFISGALINQFGLFGADTRPLDLTRVFGLGILLLGTWLVIRSN